MRDYKWVACLRTHSSDAMACPQRAHKGASALQHGIDAGRRGVELIDPGWFG